MNTRLRTQVPWLCLILAGSILAPAQRASANDVWRVVGGKTEFTIRQSALASCSIEVLSEEGVSKQVRDGAARVLSFAVGDGTDLTLVSNDGAVEVVKGRIEHNAGLMIRGPQGDASWPMVTLIPDHRDRSLSWFTVHDKSEAQQPGLFLRDSYTRLDAVRQELRVEFHTVEISAMTASRLGLDELAGTSVGRAVMTLQLQLAQSDEVYGASGSDESWGESAGTGTTGPDIIVAKLQDIYSWGYVGDISAFSVGTTSCNLGDEEANWVSATNRHPVISQGMYRLKDNRFEQIGLSWVKHGFFALAQTECGPCIDPHSGGTTLGIGCSDPYSASLNGLQSIMSPQSLVDPHTGFFVYPPEIDNRPCTGCNKIDRRLQVYNSDLDPALNPGAKYFMQGMYVSLDDAGAGNGNNNASYRLMQFVDPTYCPFVPSDGYCARVDGETVREKSAIRAWHDLDSSVEETDIQLTGNGLFILAAKPVDLGNGFYRYEYAVQNLNSSCSGSWFEIPIPVGADVRNVGFHDVDRHSGDIYRSDDWTIEVTANAVRWSTDDYDTSRSANVLQWDMLFNFWFEANVPPGDTNATLGLYEPSCAGLVRAQTKGPLLDIVDCNGNSIADACDLSCDVPGCTPPCGGATDCNNNLVPDDCEPDCNHNGVADSCDLAMGTSNDCNGNLVPDGCEPDCDGDGIPDVCDDVVDTDQDGVDDCHDECPNTTPPDSCVCPEYGCCYFASNPSECYTAFTREQCIASGGTPDCTEAPCRNGCLIADSNGDGQFDLRDLADLTCCFSGTGTTAGFVRQAGDCAKWFDVDDDSDVDVVDYRFWFDAMQAPR